MGLTLYVILRRSTARAVAYKLAVAQAREKVVAALGDHSPEGREKERGKKAKASVIDPASGEPMDDEWQPDTWTEKVLDHGICPATSNWNW